jgi:hypothetical protein
MVYSSRKSQKSLLLNKERKYLISQFPNVKPFYEKTLHNKVDIKNRFYISIPMGRKYFIWFTYLNGKPVCISLSYMFKTRSFHQIKQISCNFDPVLSIGTGTILYGTHILIKNKNVFNIENVFYYKNKKMMFESQYNKFTIIHNILKSHLSSKIYLKHEYLFKVPLISNSYKSIYSKIHKLPYSIYCIQHRSWTENIYINEKVEINKIDCATFRITAEVNTDIYNLFCLEKENLVNVGYAYIGNIKTSKFMNKLFRCIRENDDIDLIEESEDEECFEDMRLDKFILNKSYNIECIFNKKFNKWEPVKLSNNPIIQKQELMFFEK